ncbi:MAG: argininosuccinate lyase [Anaerolineae bacterium]
MADVVYCLWVMPNRVGRSAGFGSPFFTHFIMHQCLSPAREHHMQGHNFASTSERIKVPHDPLYVDYWDRECFLEEMRYRFPTLIDTHRAWLVMLVEQGIVPREDAAKVLLALKELKGIKPESFVFRPGQHDVYTHMEEWLRQRAGKEAVAHLSLARTRPEPLFRMYFRGCILDCLDELIRFRSILLDVAEKHKDAVMPGYTHQQHAQPTTFGAYLLAIHDPLRRTTRWMEMAYETTNESTMGCGALAGTAFPIDRYRVADLLGFDDIMESAHASVSTGDHLIQATSAASDAMITVSRLCVDLEVWSNTESRFVDVAPEFADVSSLMPQKKNPDVFEIARGKAARVLGDTVGVFIGLTKAFYADVLDLKLCYGPALRVLDETGATMRFLGGVVRTLGVDRERMLEAARKGFSTASELADEIFRHTGLPHRLAHSVVANVVTRAVEAGLVATDVTAALVEEVAQETLGRSLGLSEEQVRKALDPVRFVETHDLPGGPAPREVLRMVQARRERLAEEQRRQADRRARLEAAARKLDQAVEGVIQAAGLQA